MRSATASPAAMWTAIRSTRAWICTASFTPASVYGTDTLSIGNVWSFTVSGRYNRTPRRESWIASRPAAVPARWTATNVFDRFNPAAGITFSPWRGRDLNFYASYGEGNRAPDFHRAGLRRSESALQAAERHGRRSSAQSGRDAHLGIRRCVAARKRASRGASADSWPTIATTSCLWRRTRPASAISRISARRGAPGMELDARQPHRPRGLRRRLHVSGRDVSERRDGGRIEQQLQ